MWRTTTGASASGAFRIRVSIPQWLVSRRRHAPQRRFFSGTELQFLCLLRTTTYHADGDQRLRQTLSLGNAGRVQILFRDGWAGECRRPLPTEVGPADEVLGPNDGAPQL